MRGLYEEHRGKLECFELIAEQIAAGFTANQVGVPGRRPSDQPPALGALVIKQLGDQALL